MTTVTMVGRLTIWNKETTTTTTVQHPPSFSFRTASQRTKGKERRLGGRAKVVAIVVFVSQFKAPHQQQQDKEEGMKEGEGGRTREKEKKKGEEEKEGV